MIQWLSTASRLEKNYFWTHVVDVLLYRFFPLIRQQVRLHVMLEVAKSLELHMRSGPVDATVLGYSLGTAVAHDALAQLGTADLDHSAAFRADTGFKFENFVMVANVGKILESDIPVYNSVVQPIAITKPDGFCRHYLNFRNVFDPFPWPSPFRPQWGTADFESVDDLRHIHQFNTHALEHYLDHPAVHIRILHALFGPKLTASEIAGAIAAYDPCPLLTRCRGGVETFKTTVQSLLGELDLDTDPAKLASVGSRFLATAEEARIACG